MELSNSLELVVRDFGHSILSSPRLINILNDYNAFKNNIAAKLIMQTAISSNYIERFLKIGKYDTHAQLLIDSFSNEFGFKHENVHAVFRALATALNWDVKAFENIASRMNDIQEKSLMDETISILKDGAIFCKKGNQITLLTLDGKKSIPSIIPYDYQCITKDGIIITKSSVFGYEPYDLFYAFECGGLVQPKYRELVSTEYDDTYSYCNKYGYNNQGMISFNGETIIPFEYSSLEEIRHDGVFYAIKYLDLGNKRKAQIVDLKGKIILDDVYLDQWGPMDQLKHGLIEKNNDGKSSYYNTSGINIFQSFDRVRYVKSGKFIEFYKNKKQGVADSNGNIIISPIFDYCFIYEDCNLIKASLGNKDGLFNIDGSCLTSFDYDDMRIYRQYSIIVVKKDNRFGAINMQGKEIIPCEFEELKIDTDNICYGVQQDSITGKFGVFDHTHDSGPDQEGRMVIPYIFDSNKIYSAIIVKKNGMYGMYGFNGRKIVDCIYKELTLCINGTAKFTDDKGQGIISCHDRELFRTSFKYRFIQPYSNNNRHIAVQSGLNCNDKWGLLDARGNEVTEFIYDGLEHISYGLIKTSIKIKTDSCYSSNYYLHGLINSYGETILQPEFKNIKCISEKLFKIEISYNKYFCCNENGVKIIDDFYNLGVYGNLIIISRENGQYERDGYTYTKYKYQIYDKAGNLVNQAVYDEIGDDYSREFVLGLLKVSRNGKIGFINECGEEVIKCEYDDVRTPIKIQ